MQIHDLPTGTMGSTDYIALDNGTNNRKINYGGQMGATSISGIGDGTITGAISTLNSKTGSVRFNATAGTIGAGNCIGTYDKASKTVRVIFHWSSNNAYDSGTTLFTVPSGYRPSGSYNGSCFAYRSDLYIAGICTINSSGQITQGAAATANGGFGVIEYPV